MAEAIKMGGGTSKIANGQRVLAYSLGEKVKSNTFVKSITDLKSAKPKVNHPTSTGELVQSYTFENSFNDNAILGSISPNSQTYLKIFKINEKNEISAEGSWLQVNFPSGIGYNLTEKTGPAIIVGDYIIILFNQPFDSRDYRVVAALCKRNGMEISFVSSTTILRYDQTKFAPGAQGVQWFLAISKMKENKIIINLCASEFYVNSGHYTAFGVLCEITNNNINLTKQLYSFSSPKNIDLQQSSMLRGINVYNSSDGELCWVSGRYMSSYPISSVPFVNNPKFFNYNGDVVDYNEMTQNVSTSVNVKGYIYPLGNNKYLMDNFDNDISTTGYIIATIDLINKQITFPTTFYRDGSDSKAFILYKNKVYLIRGNFILEFLPSTNTMVVLANSTSHKIYNYVSNFLYSTNYVNNIKYSYINDKDCISFFVNDLVNDTSYYIHNEIPVDRWLPENIVVDDTSVTKDNLYGVTQTTCSKNKKGKVTVPLSV